MRINRRNALGLAGALTVIVANLVFAEESVDELRPIDLDGDGRPETVSLTYSEPDDYGNCSATLRVESLGQAHTLALKEGFHAEMTYLKSLALAAKIKPFIVVDAVMNKSMNRRIYSFDGRQMKEELMIFSNVPLMLEKDTDHDGVNEIIAKNDGSINRTYKWNGARFYDITPKIPESQPSPKEEF